ncbi:TolC family protein [Alteromonadaceae bacterium BrNp21-10]|nr:TolC family protein [Alteromonadaceae bacterium BrNp21-10]
MLLKYTKTTLLLFLLLPMQLVQANEVVSLTQAINQAQQNDPWLQGNKFQQQSLQAQSIAAGSLPDPNVSIGLMNMPMDSWDFNQEAMTQMKVGVTQMLPRGDSLAIQQAQLQTQAAQMPLLRQDRNAKMQSIVSQLWLDAYLAQKSIKLINKDKALFVQMVDIAKANYASALGKTRQQDVIRAQLELIQLDDRLFAEQQKQESALAKLNQWLQPNYAAQAHSSQPLSPSSALSVSEELPNIVLPTIISATNSSKSSHQLLQQVSHHPLIQSIELKYQAATQGVELAKQKYKPQWGVNASYAYRGDADNGMNRSDFFSIGLSFDVPLFTKNKQDKQVEASFAQAEVIKTEKLLLLRNMLAQIDNEQRQLQRLSDRQSLYAEQLLDQIHEQAEASLTAYTNDDGDFSEVVRARIAELNARISALQIDIDVLKTSARLNYYLVGTSATTLENVGE